MRRAPRGVHACGFLRASPPGVTARAVDRPSGGNSFDVACGVVIGVGLVAADGAGKQAPAARPRLGIAVPARRAPLGGAGRRNQPQLRPELGRLVGKLPAPLVRAVVKDAAVQPCLGPYASAGSQGGALALLVMPFTRRSSIPTQPWLLARSVVSLWVKSSRLRACRALRRAIWAMVRRSLRE